MSARVNKPNTRGVRHVVQAGHYTIRGLKAAVRYEAAFRIELVLMLLLAPLGLWLGTDGVERALLLGSLVMVLVVELLNSALEAVVDRVGVEHHTLSGRAKDLGSAAVFMSLLNVVVVWGAVLYDKL